MTYMMILGIYFAILFGVFFVGRRKIGLPILGLVAGALLSNLWTGEIAPYIASFGLMIQSPPLTSIVAVTLTFLPAILLLLRTAKTNGTIRRILDSLLFALVGIVLTYQAFSDAVVLDAASENVMSDLLPYSGLLVTIGVCLAVFDVISQKGHKGPGRPKK